MFQRAGIERQCFEIASDGTGWISMDVGHIHIHGSWRHIHIQYPVDNPWISSTSMDVLAQYS
jgi:hypothetical protein